MALKPGTRCECRERNHTSSPSESDTTCHAAAVRLVTVVLGREHTEADDESADTMGPLQVGVETPMCAACAEYHEGRGK